MLVSLKLMIFKLLLFYFFYKIFMCIWSIFHAADLWYLVFYFSDCKLSYSLICFTIILMITDCVWHSCFDPWSLYTIQRYPRHVNVHTRPSFSIGKRNIISYSFLFYYIFSQPQRVYCYSQWEKKKKENSWKMIRHSLQEINHWIRRFIHQSWRFHKKIGSRDLSSQWGGVS